MKFFLIILLSLFDSNNSGEVLMLLPFGSKSHKIVFEPLARELGARGHHVTIVSPFKPSTDMPNVTEVVSSHVVTELDQELLDLFIMMGIRGTDYSSMKIVADYTGAMCDEFFQSGLLQDWHKSGKRFDSVVVDGVLTECLLPVSFLFTPAVVSFNTGFLFPWLSIPTGIPTPYAYVPFILSNTSHKMTFWQRMTNTLNFERYMFYLHWLVYSAMEKATSKYFPEATSIDQSLKELSLILVNGDSVLTPPRPEMPFSISVAGLHCVPGKPLRNDLADFVENVQKPGFVYFSLGSIVDDLLTKEQVLVFLSAFEELKYKVIWKYPKEIENLPKYIKKVSWAPQKDILAHPKICAFITHAGLLSLQEAVYNHVPVVTIPLFADQYQNAAYMKEIGVAQSLSLQSLTVQNVKNAVLAACTDPHVKSRIKEVSSIFIDRSEAPLNTAVYWMELVMKHNGLPHTKSPVHHLYLHQYFSLDVLIFLTILVFCFAYFSYFLISFTVRLVRKKNQL